MNKIAKNYLLYMVYEVVALVVPLLTAPYLARTLQAEHYGIYSYVFSATSLISIISLVGLYAYGNRQTAYDRDDPKALSRMFWELMSLRLICGVIGSVMFFVYGHVSGYDPYFKLFFLFYLANVLDVSWFFVGMENMTPCTVKNVLSKLAMMAGTFLFVKDEGDVGIYLLVVAIPTFVANLAIYPLLFRKIGFHPTVRWRELPRHLKLSFLLCMPNIVSQLYLQVDKVMIEWLTGGTAQVSFYDQAEKIVVIPLSIITSLGTVMMPRLANEFAKGKKEDLAGHLVLTGQFSMFLAFPLMFGLCAVSLWAIPWYLGGEYMASAYVLMILSPYVLFNSMTGVSYQYFLATDQPRILLWSSLAAAGTNLCLNAIMIPFWGCYGAAVATVLSNLVAVIVQYSVMCRQIRFGAVFRSCVRYLIGGAVMAAAVVGMTLLLRLEAAVAVTLLQAAVGVVIYFVAMLVCREPLLRLGLQAVKNRLKRSKNEKE